MSPSKLLVVSVWILTATGCTSSYGLGDDEGNFDPGPDSRNLLALEDAARKTAPDLDFASRVYRTYEGRDGANAWFETVHGTLPDGTEQWKLVFCSRNSGTQQQWRCSTHDERGLRVNAPGSGTELLISIPQRLSGEAARRMVSPGLEAISRVQVQQACLSEDVDAVQHEALMKAIAGVEERDLSLMAERGGFVLRIDAYAIHFEFDLLRDSEPRIRCWEDGDEIE